MDQLEQINEIEKYPIRKYVLRKFNSYSQYFLIIPMVHATSFEETKHNCVNLFKPNVCMKYEKSAYRNIDGVEYIEYKYVGIVIDNNA